MRFQSCLAVGRSVVFCLRVCGMFCVIGKLSPANKLSHSLKFLKIKIVVCMACSEEELEVHIDAKHRCAIKSKQLA